MEQVALEGNLQTLEGTVVLHPFTGILFNNPPFPGNQLSVLQVNAKHSICALQLLWELPQASEFNFHLLPGQLGKQLLIWLQYLNPQLQNQQHSLGLLVSPS